MPQRGQEVQGQDGHSEGRGEGREHAASHPDHVAEGRVERRCTFLGLTRQQGPEACHHVEALVELPDELVVALQTLQVLGQFRTQIGGLGHERRSGGGEEDDHDRDHGGDNGEDGPSPA